MIGRGRVRDGDWNDQRERIISHVTVSPRCPRGRPRGWHTPGAAGTASGGGGTGGMGWGQRRVATVRGAPADRVRRRRVVERQRRGGGTASGGDGSWHANGAYGGTAAGGDGSWHATNAYGTTAYGGYNHYYGGTLLDVPSADGREHLLRRRVLRLRRLARRRRGRRRRRRGRGDRRGGDPTPMLPQPHPARSTQRCQRAASIARCPPPTSAAATLRAAYGANGIYYRGIPPP